MLAHYLEEEGLPTTQISLSRLHTETIKPPRALWVPFDFGRPLGVPNNHAFQKRVLLAALELLETPKGPVLVDFPEDAPDSGGEPVMLACPYFPVEESTNATETEKLCRNFKAEMASMRPWYDRGVETRKRTTVGTSKLSIENLGSFICSMLVDSKFENPRQDVPLAFELRYAADDLKAYYNEAITAQPGMGTVSSEALVKWFWQETTAGKVLLAVREACIKTGDDSLQRVARRQMVPWRFLPLT